MDRMVKHQVVLVSEDVESAEGPGVNGIDVG